jgi:hypothetical protein
MAAITVQQAANMLERLRQAAPAATAARIGQVMELIDELSQENSYLNALIPDTSALQSIIDDPSIEEADDDDFE